MCEVDEVLAADREAETDLVPVAYRLDNGLSEAPRGPHHQHSHGILTRRPAGLLFDYGRVELVKIGVGLATGVPTATGRDSQRGSGVVAGDDRVASARRPAGVELLDLVDARHRHELALAAERRHTLFAECGRNGESRVLQSSTHWAATWSTVASRSRWDSSFIL